MATVQAAKGKSVSRFRLQHVSFHLFHPVLPGLTFTQHCESCFGRLLRLMVAHFTFPRLSILLFVLYGRNRVEVSVAHG